MPPRDDRPDAVQLHLTAKSYREMVEMALSAVSGIPAAELLVKLHPRTPDDSVIRAALARFAGLRGRVVSGRLDRWLAEADCVLSCVSSAGVDAALAGLPVIQLLPAGSGSILPHADWGFCGTARTAKELGDQLAQVLAADTPPAGPLPRVFDRLDGTTAARVARRILVGRASARLDEALPQVQGVREKTRRSWWRAKARPTSALRSPETNEH